MAEEQSKPDQHRSETVVLTATEPLKALGVNDENPQLARVGAYAVRFAGPDEKDLAGEYFTAETDFGKTNGDGAMILFNHGQAIGKSEALKSIAEMTFGVAKSLKDDIGIFIETVLDLADDYQKAIYELIEQGKLAWSTGSASHVVKKAEDGCIKRWPIIESSFTPIPCEPRLPKIAPLKSVVVSEDIKSELKAALTAAERARIDAFDAEYAKRRSKSDAAAVDTSTGTKATPMDNTPDNTNDAAKNFDAEAETKKLRAKLLADQNEIRAIGKKFAKFGGDVKAEEAVTKGLSPAEFQKSLVESFNPEAIATAPAEGNGDSTKSRIEVGNDRAPKTLGEALISNDAFKSFIKSGRSKNTFQVDLPNVNLKATFLTSTGPLTSYDRVQTGGVMVEQQRLTISDLLAQGTSDGNQIRYWKEDTYTNAATTVAEEGQKPEASWDISEVTANFSKIAVIGRVSDELFEDFPAIRAYVDGRLRFMVEEREEAQVLNGNGSGSNLTGILQTSGIQTQAMGSDNGVIALHKAKTKVRAAGHFEPDGVVIHPNDFEELKLTLDSNDQFYGGGPFYSPYAGSGAYMQMENIWGMKAVITTAITEGTALVGAFKLGAQLFRKGGLRVDTTNSDASDFAYNRIAIRVEERVALAVYRPLAFCKVTGI